MDPPYPVTIVSNMGTKSFRLAPMSGLILVLTVTVFPVPFVMAASALYSGFYPILGVAGFMFAIWAFVYLYMRPARFVVTPSALEIVWPLRRERFSTASVDEVEQLGSAEFRRRFGYGMRIGAGGLWGAFGLYKTKTVTFRFYISRQDDYVIVHMTNGRPLLLTPNDVDGFCAALSRGTGRNRDTLSAPSRTL